MNSVLLAAVVFAGVAVGFLIWGLRGILLRRFRRDAAWVRDTHLRFNPDPVNAEAYTVGYYVIFLVLLFLLLALLPSPVLALGFWILSLFLPRILIEWAWKRRLRKIDLQISQSVASLSNSMRAGLTLVQSITRLADQAPEPIKGEFKIMSNQYGYGADMETVLRNAKARLGLPNFTLFASALLLNREMGGDISDTLTRISKSLDKLHEMRKTVEAHTSEGRTNIQVLLLAPVVMLLLIAAVDPRDVSMLFTTTPGVAVLTVACALSFTGWYLASRITRSEICRAMNPATATMLSLAAAILVGSAVMLLVLAAWNLVRKQRFTRSGSSGISMRRAEMRQLAVEHNATFRFLLPFITALASSINRLGMEPLRQYVHEPYVRAGYPGGLDDDELVTTGVMLSVIFTFVIGFLSVVFFGFGLAWIGLIGVPLGFFALVAHLKSKAKERQVAIMRAMPYAIDLLVLMMRSGTSLRIALARVIDDYQRHPFGVEFGQVLAEMDVGASRIDAFKKLADRLKIADITALVDAVVQSEELGWPLADTLERLADRMNSDRILRAQATAGAAGVLVMLPSTLVLLSAVILLFAPFIVRYMVTGTLGD